MADLDLRDPVHNLKVNKGKMDVSQYLSAIQSLNGLNPGDKYKELHCIASQIIANEKEKEEFITTGATDRVHLAMIPHLQIIVGNKLKVSNAVIEALKSDDVTIIKIALNAKWFFNSSNALIQVDYFVANVLPYISPRTRLELIKTLSHCLRDEPKKAESFFSSCADLYGLEQALPLILACSEKYIFDVILKRRIILPNRILSILYRRYPKLVLRYLQLGNEKNEENKVDRKVHAINLSDYSSFLPMLVKHHTPVFVELYESLPYRHNIKLGSTRAEFFLKNATDVLIKRPLTFLNLLPLKLVSNKLSTQQFESMFENLFPKTQEEFSVGSTIDYLQYYPQEKKAGLLMKKYKQAYGKDLLDDKNLFASFVKTVPTDMKKQYGRKVVDSFLNTPEYYNNVYRLPPKESIPILKDRITKPSEIPRSRWIEAMITSCSLYDSKEDLLEVLRYYNARHKNEQDFMLHQVLNTLIAEFDIKSLERAHWQELKDIIQRAYVKGHLFTCPAFICEPLFKGALHHYLKQCRAEKVEHENKVFLEKLMGIIVECYLEHDKQWEFVTDCIEIERDCLQDFLSVIPQKYPETHAVWKKNDNKVNITSYLVESMNCFNVKNLYTKSKEEKYFSGATCADCDRNEITNTKFTIKDYVWLVQFATDILKANKIIKNRGDKRKDLLKFKKILRGHDREFYQSLIDADSDMVNETEIYDALALLKYESKKVLAKWELYLNVCREKLQTSCKPTKRFIAATKWHQDIPIKFVEKCLLEIQEKSSILVLGILLDGETFGKIITPYLPKDKVMDIENEDAKKTYEIASSLPKAINLSNPPVSFDIIALFCQGDYVSLAAQSLTSVAQRVPVDRALAFAKQIVNKPVSVKKLGIRLVFQVATNIESREFLEQRWSEEKNPSIRQTVASMILDLFKQSPNPESWALMKICINGLSGDDETVLDALTKIQSIDKNYVTPYIEEIFKKIDGFSTDDLDEQRRSSFFRSFVKNIDERIIHVLPEELITCIMKKQFFKYPVPFIFNIYLFSDANKFEGRLKLFIEILEEEMQKFNEPDPKRPRYYPTNCRIRSFFSEMKYQLTNKNEKNEMCLRITTELLTLFGTKLKIWYNPHTYMALNIYKDFFESKTSKEFGTKCVATVKRLVKEFGSEIILTDVAQDISSLLYHATVYGEDPGPKLRMTIVESLAESDARIGALIGLKILNCYEIRNYDDRYDKLIKMWRESGNPTVQAALNDFINDIPEAHFTD